MRRVSKFGLAASVKNSKRRNRQCRRNYSAEWIIHQDQEAAGLKFHGFQMLSNVCVGRGASRHRQQKAEATPRVPSVTLSGRLLVWPWAIRFPVGIPYQAPTSTLHPPLEAGISGGLLGRSAASLCLPFFGESINYCQLILVSHHNINWPPATNRTPPLPSSFPASLPERYKYTILLWLFLLLQLFLLKNIDGPAQIH